MVRLPPRLTSPSTFNESESCTAFNTESVLFTFVAPETSREPAAVVEPLMLRLPSTCNKSLTLRFFVFHGRHFYNISKYKNPVILTLSALL